MICFKYRTPSAALYALTERRCPYEWWGITIGRWFFGVMRHVGDEYEKSKSEDQRKNTSP